MIWGIDCRQPTRTLSVDVCIPKRREIGITWQSHPYPAYASPCRSALDPALEYVGGGADCCGDCTRDKGGEKMRRHVVFEAGAGEEVLLRRRVSSDGGLSCRLVDWSKRSLEEYLASPTVRFGQHLVTLVSLLSFPGVVGRGKGFAHPYIWGGG
jgi:hypothetical protein